MDLWAPGERAEEEQAQGLAGDLGMHCRGRHGSCKVGAKGDLAIACAMRAIAQASEAENAPLEFRVHWQEGAQNAAQGQPEPGRWLQFQAEMRYNWSTFRHHWDASSQERRKPMPVTPATAPLGLARALLTEERKRGGAALALNPNNDAVMSVAAKALAELPHAAARGGAEESSLEPPDAGIVCVLRWPRSRGAARVYAHVFRRFPVPEAGARPS